MFTWAAIWAAFGFRYDAIVNKTPGVDRFYTADVAVPAGQTEWELQSRALPTWGPAVAWARGYRLLPESYLYGFLGMMQWARGRDNFLNGERSYAGWPSFFPLCFLYKTPLSVLAMLVVAAAGVFRGRRRGGLGAPADGESAGRAATDGGATGAGSWTLRRLAYETAPLWMLVIIYWVFALDTKINIGHRHLLPTFAPLFIGCGAAGVWLRRGQGITLTPPLSLRGRGSRQVMRFVVPGLLLAHASTSLRTWPDYLAYFNVIAGGPSQGYRHLVASSLDWGQDLPGLEAWLKRHGRSETVYLSYFGNGQWKRAPVPIRWLPARLSKTGFGWTVPTAGVYCISATRLQQVYALRSTRWTEEYEHEYRQLMQEAEAFERSENTPAVRSALLAEMSPGFRERFHRFQDLRFGRLCAYLRGREPDDFVGYSILIYRLTEEQVRTGLYGPVGDPRADGGLQ